jgi:hypothetical protein
MPEKKKYTESSISTAYKVYRTLSTRVPGKAKSNLRIKEKDTRHPNLSIGVIGVGQLTGLPLNASGAFLIHMFM